MTEAEVKDLLDSLVEENERDFTVVFTPRKTSRKHGSYRIDLKRIAIYEKALPEKIDRVGTALHELAHHLVWTKCRQELMEEWRRRKRFPDHARTFKRVLTGILDTFNSRYAEEFQGIFVLDRREPRYAPRFIEFQGGITAPEDLVAYDKAVNKLLDAILRAEERARTQTPVAAANENLQGLCASDSQHRDASNS